MHNLKLKFLSLAFALPLLTSCVNEAEVSMAAEAKVASTDPVNDKATSALCLTKRTGPLFHSGSGTSKRPYVLCSGQDVANIGSAIVDIEDWVLIYPYMNKHFILGDNIVFEADGLDFLPIGSAENALINSPQLTTNSSDLSEDELEVVDWLNGYYFGGGDGKMEVILLDGGATDGVGNIPKGFIGTFDGNGYSVSFEINPYQQNFQGFFGLIKGGGEVKNLIVKDSKIHGSNLVNSGFLAGSIFMAESTQVTLEGNTISNSSIYNAYSLVGGFFGAVNVGKNAEFSMTNNTISAVTIDTPVNLSLVSIQPTFSLASGLEVAEKLFVMDGMAYGVAGVSGWLYSTGLINIENNIFKDITVSHRTTSQSDFGSNWAFGLFGEIGHTASTAKFNYSYNLTENFNLTSKQALIGAGFFAGYLGLWDGNATFNNNAFLNVSIKSNTLNSGSRSTWGVGFCGECDFEGAGSFKFEKLLISGSISAPSKSGHGDIGAVMGPMYGRDTAKLSFSDIYSDFSLDIAGKEFYDLGTFAYIDLRTASMTIDRLVSKISIKATGVDGVGVGGLGLYSSGTVTINNAIVAATFNLEEDTRDVDTFMPWDISGLTLGTNILVNKSLSEDYNVVHDGVSLKSTSELSVKSIYGDFSTSLWTVRTGSLPSISSNYVLK